MAAKPFAVPAVVFLAGATLASPAYAYLDPGTGSMLLQLLLGGVAGLVVIGKLYWMKFKGLFVRRPADAATPDTDKGP